MLHIICRKSRRRGFSFPEIIVGLAILGILATVIFAQVSTASATASAQDRIAVVAAKLDELARAIAFFESTKPATSFRQTVGVYPSRLSQLVTAITAADANSCTALYTSGQVAAWKGNYYSQNIPVGGYKLEEGFTTQDLLSRQPANTSIVSAGVLNIIIPGVARSDAAALSLAVDGDSTGTLGAIRYTASGDLPVTVSYRIEVGGC